MLTRRSVEKVSKLMEQTPQPETPSRPSAHAYCSDLLDWLNAECFDLRCEAVPTGGDDTDIIWVVYSHHMAKPVLRAEGYGKTAAAAIRDAMLPKGDPRRWDYVPPDDQNSQLNEPSA